MLAQLDFVVPETLSFENLAPFLRRLADEVANQPLPERVCFDFSRCSYISPVPITAIMSLRDHLASKHVLTFARGFSRPMVRTFAEAFGLVKPRDAESYLLRRLQRYAVKVHRCASVAECVSAEKEIMRRVVERTGCNKETQLGINYMLTEVWDNAGNHGYMCYGKNAYPLPIYLCAFSYRSHVEVAIVDRGIGIHSHLTRGNSSLQGASSVEALSAAVKYKITGHPKGSPGYGLPSTIDLICSNGGQMNIWSSGARLETRGGQTTVKSGPWRLGTIVAFRIDSRINVAYEEVMSRDSVYRRDVEEEWELLSRSLFGKEERNGI